MALLILERGILFVALLEADSCYHLGYCCYHLPLEPKPLEGTTDISDQLVLSARVLLKTRHTITRLAHYAAYYRDAEYYRLLANTSQLHLSARHTASLVAKTCCCSQDATSRACSRGSY